MKRTCPHNRSAFTLLEVMLALGLTVVVLGIVAMSVNGTLMLVDHGRVKTERDQLARAVLARIGDDVRGVVRYEPFDASGMMSVKSSSKSGSNSGGSSSGTSGGGNSGGGKSGGGSSASGGTSSGGSGSGGSSSSSSGSSSSSQSSTSSTTSTASTTIAGIYGDQYTLQVDVGRLPRVDEYAAANSSSASSSVPPSDVRTVSYYVAGSAGQSTIAAAANSSVSGSGLVRTELDRAMSQYATTQGDSSSVNNSAVIFAPEVVALEFQYFDGTQWNTAWDSTQNSGLPQAVKISIALAGDNNSSAASSSSVSSISDAASQDPDSVYSLVVLVPARDPVQLPAQSASSSGSSSSSTGSSNSTGGSGTSGAAAGGGS
jgi:hypothetical protein